MEGLIMLKEMLYLSDTGVKHLKKAVFADVLVNMTIMMTMFPVLMFLDEMLQPLIGGQASNPSLFFYPALSFFILLVLYFVYSFEYENTYNAAFRESATRRIDLAEKLRKLPLSFFGQKDLPQMTSVIMEDCTALERTFSHAIPKGIGTFITLILLSISLVMLDAPMALALFLPFPLSIGIILIAKKIMHRANVKNLEIKLEASAGVQECLETIKDIKAFNLEEEYLKGLDKKLDDVFSNTVKIELIIGTLVTSARAILPLGFALIILLGTIRLANADISLLTFLLFIMASARLQDPFSELLFQVTEVLTAFVRVERMKYIESYPIQSGDTTYKPENYDIEFENISFSYGKEQVLDNASFTAKQGEVTALVGPSGSGKSTISKLVARFWDPNKGKVSIGNTDISSIDPETLYKHISMVFQEVTLFDNSLKENIRVGRQSATDEEVYAVAKLAHCEEFIEKLPDGYDTMLGENGKTLSGGERQRISIARALLKNAPIILLDEATASLDVNNESLIQEAISTLIQNKTVLVIAHRVRTFAGADKIVVLEEGKVVEQGSHDELMKNKALYSHILSVQEKSSTWEL